MSPTILAYCYCFENGEKVYDTIEADENGDVPEPWIIEWTSDSYNWKQIVYLDKVGVVNNCSITYHRKKGYNIEADKVYELTHRLECISGFSSITIGNQVQINRYSNTSIDTEREERHGYELEEYLDKLCSKSETVSMQIDDNGKFTLLSEK